MITDRAPQAFSVKRAEVEFHNFASMGEPELAFLNYAEENLRRGGLIRKHKDFIGQLTPYLEVGANAGHSSYMLSNEFGADGFALDISADALRYGTALMDHWELSRAPVRVAGDAVNLPFRDDSLPFVMAFQTLSQFLDMESVFVEVKRVLAPGGVFFFAEEPLLRLLSLRLYRCPYYNRMQPWERRLYRWGLLGYLVRDVIGAAQEESFGIRQNHSMYLSDWHHLIQRHFVAQEYEIFVPERGWGERIVKKLAIRADPHHSEWRGARLLGGTLAAFCRKQGNAPESFPPIDQFESYLRCPDCHADLTRGEAETLSCAKCNYRAPFEGGVYNLLPAAERAELYPGDRVDVIDFCLPEHESRLLEGWYDLEGVFGNKFRWIGEHAAATLVRVKPGPQRLRIRGHVHERSFEKGQPVIIEVAANGQKVGKTVFRRSGLFVFEADLPEADQYRIDIWGAPLWECPPDDRVFTLNLAMLRLVERE